MTPEQKKRIHEILQQAAAKIAAEMIERDPKNAVLYMARLAQYNGGKIDNSGPG